MKHTPQEFTPLADARAEEATCRHDVLARRTRLLIEGSRLLAARRAEHETPEAKREREQLPAKIDTARKDLAERVSHYRAHSDLLLAMLREDARLAEEVFAGIQYGDAIRAEIEEARRNRRRILGAEAAEPTAAEMDEALRRWRACRG